MANVYCPNCRKAHSDEAKIAHCLNCAHPFNVFLWKRAAVERAEKEEQIQAERDRQREIAEQKRIERSNAKSQGRVCEICDKMYDSKKNATSCCSGTKKRREEEAEKEREKNINKWIRDRSSAYEEYLYY